MAVVVVGGSVWMGGLLLIEASCALARVLATGQISSLVELVDNKKLLE